MDSFLAIVPMETNQLKKKGRKKKNITQSESEGLQQNINPGTNESDGPSKRSLMIRMYENKASKLDKALRKRSFILNIHNRMTRNRQDKIETQYEGFDRRNVEIYEKFCNSTENSDENMQWHVMISPQIIRRMCNMMNFLLMNGPMTNAEESIFKESVSVLKSYYEERSILVSIESAAKELYRSTTYYPDKETAVYKFINEIMLVPTLDKLEDYTKKGNLTSYEKNIC